MNIIICGAGRVGYSISNQLSKQGHSITVIDKVSADIQKINDNLDARGVVGIATYPSVLEKADAKNADMIIAVTRNDETNMIVCQIAHSLFSIPRKIARLRSQSYLDAIYSDLYRRDHLPIDVVISPELEVAEAALKRLSFPNAFESENFLDNNAQLLGLHIEDNCPVINTPLRQLTDLFSTLRVIVVGVRRKGVLFAPNAGDQLFCADEVYLMCHSSDASRTMDVFGKSPGEQNRIILIGGGNVGLRIAKTLEAGEHRIRAKIIETNRSRAEFAAGSLERTIVLHGDGLDSELLEEANVSKTDAILTVTDDDKTNMLAAVRAKSKGCHKAIAIINDPTMSALMEPLGIDAYINPRSTTVSSILRHIRHGKVKNVYSIGDAEAEIIEAQVMSTSPIAGSRIGEIDFPEGVIVGGILKEGEMLKPDSSSKIEEGDVIALFALSKDIPEVERLLQVTIDYF